ncbi:hypothetical protein B7P43_G10016 [Cryptotermes secundus]|uniref:Uncharacterized protein n=1 Tax=Cryptotermes secundus TaxID=105785 RepID=A0A2J7QBF3_9NEOP|nr:hypothetical protein B7P43_G10016 [Cryptotermes secundus]
MKTWGWWEGPKCSEKNKSQCHQVNTNSIWIALGLNPGLISEKSATNHLSYNMAHVCV